MKRLIFNNKSVLLLGWALSLIGCVSEDFNIITCGNEPCSDALVSADSVSADAGKSGDQSASGDATTNQSVDSKNDTTPATPTVFWGSDQCTATTIGQTGKIFKYPNFYSFYSNIVSAAKFTGKITSDSSQVAIPLGTYLEIQFDVLAATTLSSGEQIKISGKYSRKIITSTNNGGLYSMEFTPSSFKWTDEKGKAIDYTFQMWFIQFKYSGVLHSCEGGPETCTDIRTDWRDLLSKETPIPCPFVTYAGVSLGTNSDGTPYYYESGYNHAGMPNYLMGTFNDINFKF